VFTAFQKNIWGMLGILYIITGSTPGYKNNIEKIIEKQTSLSVIIVCLVH
jgi:hypothetical protein